MTLAQIIKKFEDKEMPRELRRKAWQSDKNMKDQLCIPSCGGFYTDRNWDMKFEFTKEDLVAKDWEYSEVVWRSK